VTTCQPIDAGAIDQNQADAGMQLILQYHCYACHQATNQSLDASAPFHGLILAGNSAGIGDSGTYPPNLTPDPGTGLGCWTNQQIATALLDGIDDQDASLCIMPRFRGRFSDAGVDIDASADEIVEFLRSLPPVTNAVPSMACPSSLGGDAASE
jgi:hypothetical protein